MMFNEINEDLLSIKEKIQEKQKLVRNLETIEYAITVKRNALEDLEKKLNKEKKDVEKLKSLTLTSILYSIIRTKDEHLDKEESEYIAAKIQYDDCIQQKNNLELEESSIKNKLRQLGNPESDYNVLLLKKEQLIINIDKNLGDQINSITQKQGEIQHSIKELREAISAGESTTEILTDLTETLGSAKDLGTLDLLGGGTFTTMAKHSKIDEARKMGSDASYYIEKFSKELSDVSQLSNINLDIKISSFDTFADYFFDGLIADWSVQSKINDSLNSAQDALGNVREIIHSLNSQLNALEKNLDSTIKEKKDLIEKL